MKCPECGGLGFFPSSNIAAKICPQCNGTGEIQQTNEEWFCSLDTEDKAEFLSNSGMFESRNEALFWLKEKHNEMQKL